MVANIQPMQAPTEVDHYQIRRELDIYVRPATEDRGAAAEIVRKAIAEEQIPGNVDVSVHGSAQAMSASWFSRQVRPASTPAGPVTMASR